MSFSLCITTLNRYDEFLSKYLPRYLDNDSIEEIIICDEDGNDAEKISRDFKDPKIIIHRNEEILGPFRNKIKCCSLAKNKWIALIDSDNFADSDYFKKAESYINSNLQEDLFSLIFPDFAKPQFDYRCFNKSIITRDSAKEIAIKGDLNMFVVMMNTGNFIINKNLITNLNLEGEENNISESDTCDVLYFNNLLFEQFPLKIHVLEGMEYDHNVHSGSIYLEKSSLHRYFNSTIIEKFKNTLYL